MTCRLPRLLSCLVLGFVVGCGDDSPLTPVAPAPNPVQPAPAPAPAPPPVVAATVTGTVRSVNGGPLAGVKVTSNPRGLETITGADGTFTLNNLTQTVLGFTKDGMRSTGWVRQDTTNPGVTADVKMQPLLLLEESSPVTSVITDDDLTYSSDNEDSFWGGTYQCSPCKEIRVRLENERAVRLHLEWTGPTPLDIWAGDYYSGTVVSQIGAEGASGLVIDVPGLTGTRRLNTVLVGVGVRNGQRQPVPSTISFTLTVVPRD